MPVPSSLHFYVSTLPVQAGHLDGLWRNDRMRITLRVEQDQTGFKAKRTDQGIWYHYTTNDNIRFADHNGNWYELVDHDELVWHEANRPKQVYFEKVDSRNNDRRNYDRNNDYGYDDPYDDRWNNARWNNARSRDVRNQIEGDWYELNGRDDLRIKLFDDGIKVKSDRGGWDKFYPDRTRNRFRDNQGNTDNRRRSGNPEISRSIRTSMKKYISVTLNGITDIKTGRINGW